MTHPDSGFMFFKHRTINTDVSVQQAEAPWQSCIAVCSKCARKLDVMDGEKTQLRVALKATIKERDLKKKLRAVDSSCMDVCPEGKITVTLFSPQGARVINAGGAATAAQVLAEFGY